MTSSPDQYREPLLRYYHARTSGCGDIKALEAEVLQANIGIALAFARRCRSAAQIDDLEAAASIGLLKAIRTWTPDEGANLSTWAAKRMLYEVRQVNEYTMAVRVPYRTRKKAIEAAEMGIDVESAAKEVGSTPKILIAAIQSRTVDYTPDIGSVDVESAILDAETEAMLADVAKCWRGHDSSRSILRAAESLSRRRMELLDGADRLADETRAESQRAFAQSL